MIISYVTGVEIIKEHAEQISNGQIKVLLFFLGSVHDERFLESVNKLAKDIDNITGPHCLAVAFMPPPEEIRIPVGVLPFVSCGEFGDIDIDKWPQFVEEMTNNTYELARFFEIPYDKLPCLVFCDPKEITEIAILRIRDRTLSDVYDTLRHIFSDWYSENKMILDEYDYLLSVTEYSLFRRSTSPRVKLMVEEQLRKKVIPLIEGSFGFLLNEDADFDKQKLKQIIKRLYRQPKNIKPLQDFMRLNNLTINLNDQKLTWDSLPRMYGKLLENNSSVEEATKRLFDCVEKLPDFPLDRVKRINRAAEIKRIGSNAMKLVTVKTEISTISIVRKIFGL